MTVQICKYFSAVFIFPFIFCLYWIGNGKKQLGHNFSINVTLESNPKIVLLWTPLVTSEHWHMAGKFDTSQPFELLNCENTNCILTRNRSKLEQADAVLFYIRNEVHSKSLDRPENRRSNQMFIISAMSPSNYYSNASDEYKTNSKLWATYNTISKDYFNWTMSFQSISDILNPYGMFEKHLVKNQSRINRDYWSGKTKGAFWAVSHCVTTSKREKLAVELAKYIPVEMSGGCQFKEIKHFNNCNRSPEKFHEVFDSKCEEAVERNFKFYFAFENSLCHEYVSEKFYRTATMDIIPVVFNGVDMVKIAPDHSYIDAKDFKTVQELGEYLQKVASDKDLYNSYFTWKSEYVAIYTFGKGFCNLCAKLNDFDPVRDGKVLKDVRKWHHEDCNKTMKSFSFLRRNTKP